MGGAGYELQARFSSLHNYKGKEWGKGEELEEEEVKRRRERNNKRKMRKINWIRIRMGIG